MTKLTRQGVRDLNAIGPAPRRVYRDPPARYCFHDWEPTEMDPRAAFILGIRTIRDVCRRCGEVRR